MNRVLTSWGGIACFGLLFATSCTSSSPGTTSGSGGSNATGGTTGTGGSATGGSSSTGGSLGTGGSGTGGATGGITGTGGHATGGSGTGGASGGSTGTGGGSATGGVGGSGSGTGGSGPVACPTAPPAPTGSSDAVAGTLIQFNDNGGWCWYQDERAVVDTAANKLVIATTASGGGTRNGQNEAVIYDIASGTPTKYTLPSSLASSNVDDHNSPALVIRPDGKYMAQWSGHRVDCLSRFSVFDGTKWGSEYKVDWTSLGCPWAGASTNMITYSNPWYMGSSIYTLVRSIGTDPGVLSSADNGQTFSFYGRLMDTVQVGYVAGYFKYWGNNTDRVDFVGTEAHPRDTDTSLYHGYISGGKVYNSTGTALDSSLKDTNSTTTTSVNINTYTPVFKTGSMAGSVKLCRMWNYDIARYADGSIAVLGQGRANSCTSTPSGSNPDKRAIYSRFDGTKWTTTYLVKMGPHLYSDEEDYTGLAALDPDNPNIIYISTTYDPRDDTTTTPKHEIYEGITCDNGKTFTWSPITKGSTSDNIRPIVPKWDANHTALIWLKGTYTSAQSYNLKVVGLISGK